MNDSQEIAAQTLNQRDYYRLQAQSIPMDSTEIAIKWFACTFVVACGWFLYVAYPPSAIPILFVIESILRRG